MNPFRMNSLQFLRWDGPELSVRFAGPGVVRLGGADSRKLSRF